LGSISFPPNVLRASTSEIIGYKFGLALTNAELRTHVPQKYWEHWDESESGVRLRSEAYEELVSEILFRLGTIPSVSILLPNLLLFHKYKNDPERSRVLRSIMEDMVQRVRQHSELKSKNPTDLTPVIENAARRDGRIGLDIAIELGQLLEQYLTRILSSAFRQEKWTDVVALRTLFEEEGLPPSHGEFIDQRLVDYLAANFSRLGEIHWRQFEKLAAESLSRIGLRTKLGPGRADGGIDIRAWHPRAKIREPPAVIVQCKNEKAKVSQVVVKALWADVLNEGARSGLIVTASQLSPSADAVRRIRRYPIGGVDRKTLNLWLRRMRTPWAGVFFGV